MIIVTGVAGLRSASVCVCHVLFFFHSPDDMQAVRPIPFTKPQRIWYLTDLVMGASSDAGITMCRPNFWQMWRTVT